MRYRLRTLLILLAAGYLLVAATAMVLKWHEAWDWLTS
jgi:hypothetical protein